MLMNIQVQTQQLLALLKERFPEAFPDDPQAIRPLKIGIREDIFYALGEKVEKKLLQSVLAKYTCRTFYLCALLRESYRIHLHGVAVQPVDDISKALAAKKLSAQTPPQSDMQTSIDADIKSLDTVSHYGGSGYFLHSLFQDYGPQ